jgi:hypothetical protein
MQDVGVNAHLINPLHHAPWLQKMEPALYGQEDVFDAVMFLLRCKRGHYFFRNNI